METHERRENDPSCFSKSKRKSQDNGQNLTGVTTMLSRHGCHVNLRVQNNAQRKLRRRSRKASGVTLFHSIKALYQKLLIMRQAAQTDYVHTRLIKVTCTRTPRVLPWGGLLTQSPFPHLHTVCCVSRRLSASMINESDCVPVFI